MYSIQHYVIKWFVIGWWFSLDTLVSCTNKTDRQDFWEKFGKYSLKPLFQLKKQWKMFWRKSVFFKQYKMTENCWLMKKLLKHFFLNPPVRNHNRPILISDYYYLFCSGVITLDLLKSTNFSCFHSITQVHHKQIIWILLTQIWRL